MIRTATAALFLAALHLHLHLHLPIHLSFHHHFHGSPVQYTALAAGAAASFIGIPGPGEPLLVAAGILAAQHRLDLFEVVLVAFAGASAGGIGGWILGRSGGRQLLTRPGPFRRIREAALARGEALFTDRPVMAVLLAPPWVAGITGVSARRFVALNEASAVAWAAGIGVGAFFAGPIVVDWVNDLGTFLGIALVLLIVAAVIGSRRRGRAGRARRAEARRTAGTGGSTAA